MNYATLRYHAALSNYPHFSHAHNFNRGKGGTGERDFEGEGVVSGFDRGDKSKGGRERESRVKGVVDFRGRKPVETQGEGGA